MSNKLAVEAPRAQSGSPFPKLHNEPHMTHTVPPMHYDVVVVGAGAAGLMCALTAGQRGRRVLVLEKSNKPGKKILMSGGGRCNFTNYFVEAENFVSSNPHFCKAALKRFTTWDFIALVEKYGIAYEERKHGQLFCLHSAKDILEMLLDECRLAGVELQTDVNIEGVKSLATSNESARYKLCMGHNNNSSMGPGDVLCESLVVASGALSIPTLGGSALGYELATQFGLSLTARRAGLVPFMFSDAVKPLCERLSGLATEVEISCNGHYFNESLLFTHRGISGPAVLQISNYWYPGDEIQVNLLPGTDGGKYLQQLKAGGAKTLLKNALQQKLPRALIIELQAQWWPEHADTPMARFSDSKLQFIGDLLNCWRLKPAATEGYRTAEVTLGGVDTGGISSKTMEARQQPGLYFVGEVLDVTGHLGGFNFQWAWSSGYSAGLFA